MKYMCKICEKEFTDQDIPAGAIKLAGTTRNSVLWRFPNGDTHDLKPERTPRQKLAMHNRYHVGHYILAGCEFCNPQPEQPTPPDVDPGVEAFEAEENPLAPVEEAIQELLQDTTPVTPAATPSEPEPEFHDNTMSYAFSKFKETNKK